MLKLSAVLDWIKEIGKSFERTEIWGCWDGQSEIVSIMEPTPDSAVETYAYEGLYDQHGACDGSDDELTGEFEAELSLGMELEADMFIPDFEDLIEHIEERGSDEFGLDEELIVMTADEKTTATLAYHALMFEFVNKYIKVRNWNVFPDSRTILITMDNGNFVSWRYK